MRKAHFGVFLVVLLLLVLALTAPLAGSLSHSIPYTIFPTPGLESVPLYPGDHLQFFYRLWLFVDSAARGRPFHPAGYEFNNQMGRQPFSSQFVPLSLIYALFVPLGRAAAYNLLFLAVFAMSGAFTYLLLRALGAGFWGGCAGGLTAAFLPYRLGQAAAGHPNGFVFFMLPLFLWLLELHLGKGKRAAAWAAAAVLLSQMVMELHAAFYTGLFLVFYLPVRWLVPVRAWLEVRPGGKEPPPAPSWWWAAAVPPVAVFSFRMLVLAARGQGTAAWAPVSAACWGLLAVAVMGTVSTLAAVVFGIDRGLAGRLFRPAFLPVGILPLYAVRLLHPVPYLGRFLLAAAFAGSAAALVKTVILLARARPLSFRPAGLWRGRVHGLVSLALAAAASLAWVVKVKGGLLEETAVAGGRSAAEAILFTPRLSDALARVNPSIEFFVYPGIACLAIIAAGILAGRREGGEEGAPWALFLFGGLGAAAYVLCFGERGDSLIPLHDFLRGLIPLMGYARVPSRAMLLAGPALAVCVGLSLQRALGRRRRGTTVFLLGLAACSAVMLDFLPATSLGLTRLEDHNAVYERHEGEGGEGMLLEVPLWPGDSAWSSVYQYWVTRYRHRMLNGYSPAVPAGYRREVFEPLAGVNVGHLARSEREVLDRLGVDRLVLHEEVFPPKVSLFPFDLTLRRLAASSHLRYRRRDGWLWLFEVADGPGPRASLYSGGKTDSRPGAGDPSAVTSPQGVLFQGEWPSMRPASREFFGGVRVAAGGEEGVPVVSGPGRLFPSGRFRAVVKVCAPGNEGKKVSATLRIRDDAGAQLMSEPIVLRPEPRCTLEDREFVFETEEPRRLSFEVVPDGTGILAVDYLYLTFAGEADPVERVEMEQLRHPGRITGERPGDEGAAVFLEAGHDPPMSFVMGPRRRLPGGRWLVAVRYRLGEGSGSAGRVLFSGHGGNVLGEAALEAPTGAGGILEAVSVIEQEGEFFLEVGIDYSGGRDLYLDRLEVKPG